MRVEVKPSLLMWARERAGLDVPTLSKKFPKLPEWEAGEHQPTLKQLEGFAKATHTSVGYLLLPEPPVESLPIPDFRTMGDRPLSRLSADLLDTVYACQQRQDWYRDFARTNREDPVRFVGSVDVGADVVDTAAIMRTTLGFGLDERRQAGNWTGALDMLREHAELAGVLVMVNGIVGSNSYRKLNPDEFRGFALADRLAPVIFVNGSDTKAAQIFTLAHELAHLWIGQSGLSDAELSGHSDSAIERWCNQVAAEFLVPLDVVRREAGDLSDLTSALDRLARTFKVSTLVILRRLLDGQRFTPAEYRAAYIAERDRVLALMGDRGSGGNFYNTTPVRVSKRFARALIASTWEGQTMYRDAARLLGFKKLSTLDELGQNLGVA